MPTAEWNASLNPPSWWEKADERGSLCFKKKKKKGETHAFKTEKKEEEIQSF